MTLATLVQSDLFGYLALLVQIITFTRANDQHLIRWQILFLLLLSAQFYVYGLYVACAVAILSIVRNSAQLLVPTSRIRHFIFSGFLLTPAVILLTDADTTQLIASLTWIFASVGILYLHNHKKTACMALAASIHLTFGAVIGSMPIILIEMVTLSSLAVRTWKISRT
jgi:hypothetical protein